METVSTIRRGRPSAFDPGYMRTLRGLWPEITTDRGLVAKAYEVEAVGAITCDDKAVDGVEKIFGKRVYKSTILEHLGRLKHETGCDDSDICELARIVNRRMVDDGLTVREVVGLLKIGRQAEREGAE